MKPDYGMNSCSALVRQLSNSFDNALQKEKVSIRVDVAKQQHDYYIETLSKYVKIVELATLHELPDACFVEDTCVVVGTNAVITNPGAPSRRKEVPSVEAALKGLGFNVTRMPDNICCDGGDVLFTGKNLFVGLSKRTCAASVDFLATHLKVPAFGINTHSEVLHLKSVLSNLSDGVLSCWDSEEGRDMLHQILKIEKTNVIFTKSLTLANTLSFNANGKSVVFIQSVEGADAFKQDIKSHLPKSIIEMVDMSELALADGALTCCSVLLSK